MWAQRKILVVFNCGQKNGSISGHHLVKPASGQKNGLFMAITGTKHAERCPLASGFRRPLGSGVSVPFVSGVSVPFFAGGVLHLSFLMQVENTLIL